MIMKLPNRKEMNREKMESIAEVIGDMYLTELFWGMFEDLSATNQEKYIQRAKVILKEHTAK